MGAVLLLGGAALLPSAVSAATNVAGSIRVDTTWTTAGSPYVVTGSVYVFGTVTAPATLTVQAGVEVRFDAGTLLQVGSGANKGALRAEGTAASPVVFTSNQATKTPGYWAGIRFEPGSESSGLLRFSTVEYGGFGNGALIYARGSSPTLQNSSLRQSSSYAIQVAAPGSLSLDTVTIASTDGAYSIRMPSGTVVTSAGTHSIDKPIELTGDVRSDATWRKLGAPYVLPATVSVYKTSTAAASLTIEEGVEVRLGSAASLRVASGASKGTLQALGTAAAPILFTSNQAMKTPGHWGAVRFETGAGATSLLQFTTIEFGGAGDLGLVHVAGSSALTLRNCTLRHGSSYAIKVPSDGSLTLDTVTIAATGGAYSIRMRAATQVSSAGTHSIDKPIELSGTVGSDTTWRRLGAPYVLNSTVYVNDTATSAATLTIEGGVEVRMGPAVWLSVGYGGYKGTLRTLGTAAAPVLFTSAQATKTPGSWGGLRFDPGSQGASLLEFTTIEYGGSGTVGMVYVTGASPRFQHCTVRHSATHGVGVAGAAAPALRDGTFVDNALSAVRNTGSLMADVRGSFWGHASGPSGAGGGTGQTIIGRALFIPWLEAAPNPSLHARDAQISKLVFDQTDEETAFTATSNAVASWTLTVKSSSGTTVKTYAGTGSAIGQAWNGEQSGSETKVPNGVYTLRLTASSGPLVMAPLTGVVRVTGSKLPTAVITSPAPDAVVAGGVALSIRGTAADSNDFVSYRLERGFGASPTLWFPLTSPQDVTTPVTEGELATWTPASNATGLYTLRLTVRDATSPSAVLTQPLRVFSIYNRRKSGEHFSPNGDGAEDTFTVKGDLTLPANWTLTLDDASGATVRTYSGTDATSVSQAWDGKDASGADVAEGVYTFTLAALEPGSNVAAIPYSGTVNLDRTGPTATITAPANGAIVFDAIPITGTAADPGNFDNYRVEYGAGPAPASWTSLKSSNLAVTAGTLTTWTTNSFMDEVLVPGGNGAYTIRLTVSDRAGNVATAQVVVNLDNMLVQNVSSTSTTIRPASAQTSTVTFTTNQTATVTLRIHPETTPLKLPPDQTSEAGVVRTFALGSLPAGEHSVVWDGRSDAGRPLPEEAYMYIIEARAPSGRFGKFNRYFQEVGPRPAMTIAEGGYRIPASATVFDPFKNDFFSYSFSPAGNPGRGALRIQYRKGGVTTTLARSESMLVFPGPNSVFWDGRDDNGAILTGYTSINYFLVGRITPPSEHFVGLRNNHILVLGTRPRLSGLGIKSDPYRVTVSYGQVTRLRYELQDPADVTVTVTDPTGVSRTLVSGQSQTPGEYEVEWDGTVGSGFWASPGNCTFEVTAADPSSGASTTRRGNVVVFQ